MFWMPTPDNPYLPNGLPFKLHNQVQMALEGQATDLWDLKLGQDLPVPEENEVAFFLTGDTRPIHCSHYGALHSKLM